MFETMPSAPVVQRTFSFGFAQRMRDADWSRFPSWYRERCLLTPVTQRTEVAPKFPVAA